MKVVFLDFDGVLNSRGHFLGVDETIPPSAAELQTIRRIQDEYGNRWTRGMIAHDLRSLNSEMVKRVQWLVEKTDASVVISSSWRHGHSIPAMQGLLAYHGFTGPILDVTPISVPTPAGFSNPLRGHEIQAWLDLHPEVERFVILDDDTDMAHLSEYLVRTDFAVGLTEEKALEALFILEAASI